MFKETEKTHFLCTFSQEDMENMMHKNEKVSQKRVKHESSKQGIYQRKEGKDFLV